MFRRGLILSLGVFFACAVSSNAAIVVDFQEVGPDVVVTVSGTLNTTGLTGPGGPGGSAAFMFPSIGRLGVVAGSGDTYDLGQSLQVYGPGGQTIADSSSGDTFVLVSDQVWVPVGYTSGDPINGTSTYLGTDFATLGIDAASFPVVYTLGNGDTITLGITAVPEPSTIGLCAIGLAASVFWVRRKRKSESE